MTEDPRDALERLITAFHEHFAIARRGDDADAETLESAKEALRDAFFTYDDELFTGSGVELSSDLLDDDYDEDEDYEEDEDFEDDENSDDGFVDADDWFFGVRPGTLDVESKAPTAPLRAFTDRRSHQALS